MIRQALAKTHERIETWIGFWWCIFVAVCFASASALVVLVVWIETENITACVLSAVAMIPVTFLEYRFLKRLENWSKNRVYPLGLVLALDSPIHPLWLRPLACLWWLSHFVSSGAIVCMIAQASKDWDLRFDQIGSALVAIGLLLFGIGATYASNTFLMLAVAAVFPEPAHLDNVWRRRLWIDTLLMLVAIGLMQIG